MNAMSNSAGNADKEMEVITNSLSYKMNALRETGTGIWQNIFQRESVGGVVDDLNVLLGIVEKFTDKVGLLGTVLAAAGIGSALIQFAKTSKMLATMGQSTKFLDVLRNAFPSVNNAILAYQAALKNGSSAMVAFGAGAKAMITSITPLIGVLIAIGVALAAFHAFEEANTGWTRAQESAQKAITDYQEAKEKLESLNKEKTDNLSKVQEIAAKYDIDVTGMDDVDAIIEKIKSSDKGITLVDQVELDKLSTANKQLNTQMKIQEQIERAKKQGALLETEIASKTEKSYWEEVRDKHGKGFFGTIAAGWEYINTRGGGAAADENGNPVDVGDSEGEKWAKRDTTNIGMATTAYNELIAKKQELKTLEEEMANSPDAVSQEQLDRREQLTNEIAEQGSKTATLIRTVSDELEGMKEGTSEYSQDYVERASKLVRDFTNIDATPAEAALNNLNSFFDGTSGKNAIKEQLIEAAKSGEDLESTLRGLGLSLEDLDISDASYLNDYFADLAKEVEKADDEVSNFGKTVEDVEAASKTEDADSDWTKIQAAYKKAGEYYEQGKTGIDDFKTVAQFMSSKNLGELAKQAKDAGGYAADVYQKAFEDARAKADRWFGDDEAQSLMNFADDAESSGLFNINKNDEKGLWDISVAEGFENTAQAADKLGTSVGVVETMLSGLEAYGYDFDGIEKSGEMFAEYGQTLDALNETYENMADGRGKDRLNELLNGENGFNQQYEQFEGDLSKLSEEQVIRIKFEYDLASIQTEIDYLQNLIDNGMDDDVGTRAQLLAEQDRYNATAERGLGLDQEGVKLPVEYEISKQTEESLKEQLANTTDKDEKLQLQAEIGNEQQVQQDILNTFADEHPEITPEVSAKEVNDALNDTFKDNTVEITASVDGVETQIEAFRNEDGTITYTANIDGVETEVQPVKEEDGSITYTTEIEDEVEDKDLEKEGELKYTATVEGEEKIEEASKDKTSTITANVKVTGAEKINNVTAGANNKNVSVGAKVTGTEQVGQLSGSINNLQPKTVTANAKVSGIDQVNQLHDSINSLSPKTVEARANVSGRGEVEGLKSSISGLSGKTVTITTIHKTINQTVNAVDGTAHASGTAFSKGTARKGVAFAKGNWGIKGSGTALGGELGRKYFASIHGDMYFKSI